MPDRRPELGKWLLWKWFYRDEKLRHYLPETRRYSQENCKELLRKHQSVYIKPVAGARGKNIVRVANVADKYLVHVENKQPITLDSWLAVCEKLQAHQNGRMYIVQQDVRLAKLRDRPFDVRIMMQKTAQGSWECTGICAKVAGPHSAVTNVARSKGKVISLQEALRESHQASALRIRKLETELHKVGLLTCARLEEYQRYSEIGVDVGIDQEARLWVLEQNTGPSHELFRHLADQETYRLIQKTAQERRAAHKSKRIISLSKAKAMNDDA